MDYSKYTAAIKRGDSEAFRDYMEQTIDTIYRMVCRIIASEDAAKDLVQETYIKVWEKRSTLRSGKSIYSWTKRVAVNKCFDYIRIIKRRGEWGGSVDISDLRDIASDISADDIINNEEYDKLLKEFTSDLSPKQQVVYTLAVIEKLTADEIAGLTGMSKSSIKSNLYHARKAVIKKAERIL